MDNIEVLEKNVFIIDKESVIIFSPRYENLTQDQYEGLKNELNKLNINCKCRLLTIPFDINQIKKEVNNE